MTPPRARLGLGPGSTKPPAQIKGAVSLCAGWLFADFGGQPPDTQSSGGYKRAGHSPHVNGVQTGTKELKR
jgi:hypothetical protein